MMMTMAALSFIVNVNLFPIMTRRLKITQISILLLQDKIKQISYFSVVYDFGEKKNAKTKFA